MIKKYRLLLPAFLLVASLLSATMPVQAQGCPECGYYIEGYRYYGEGKLDEAIAAFKQGLAVNPASEDIHNEVGNLYYKQGKLDEAIAAYKQAVALYPQYADAHYNLGWALKNRKDYRAALDHFNASYQLEPADDAKAEIEACEKALATPKPQKPGR